METSFHLSQYVNPLVVIMIISKQSSTHNQLIIITSNRETFVLLFSDIHQYYAHMG